MDETKVTMTVGIINALVNIRENVNQKSLALNCSNLLSNDCWAFLHIIH